MELLDHPTFGEKGQKAELSRRSGVDASYISRLLYPEGKKGKKRMAEDMAEILEKSCGLQTGWFDLPLGTRSDTDIINANTSIDTASDDSATFNVLDIRAVCGDGVINSDYPETIRTLVMSLSEAHDLFGTTNRNGRIKIITAHKDSMIPTIIPGDVLFVDTLINEFVGEAIYLLLHGGELICKRLSIVGKTLTVSSDNSVYKSWSWEDRDAQTRIVGKVIPVVWRKISF